jgi:hypothetical protein
MRPLSTLEHLIGRLTRLCHPLAIARRMGGTIGARFQRGEKDRGEGRVGSGVMDPEGYSERQR